MNSKEQTEVEWDDEIMARLEAYREGQLEAIPSEEAKCDIAARLRECQ